MDRAQNNTITDVETLHQLLAEQWCKADTYVQIIAEREQVIVHREQAITRHEQVIAERDQVIAHHVQTIVHREARIAALTAEIARLRRVQFAARSEKMDPTQRTLFDEAMAADIAAVEAELAALQAPAVDAPAAPSPRTVPKRRALPEHLPRVETRHDLAGCICGQCGGDLVHIGDHVSGPLLRVLRLRHLHIHVQRSCRASRCSSSCAATCIRSTIGACSVALQPLVDRLRTKLKQHPILHADETPVAMLDPGAGETRRSYLFAYAAHG